MTRFPKFQKAIDDQAVFEASNIAGREVQKKKFEELTTPVTVLLEELAGMIKKGWKLEVRKALFVRDDDSGKVPVKFGKIAEWQLVELRASSVKYLVVVNFQSHEDGSFGFTGQMLPGSTVEKTFEIIGTNIDDLAVEIDNFAMSCFM